MKLSTRGRYSVRIMLELGKNYYKKNNTVMELNKIAKAQTLSLKYIEHIISDLKRYGLVTSTRGVSGGYKLTRSPEKITLYDVLQATENIANIVKCIHKKTTCIFAKFCNACDIWEGLQKAITDYLRSKKLNEMIKFHESNAGRKVSPESGELS